MKKLVTAWLALALVSIAPAAWAADLALIIANTAYRDLPYRAEHNQVMQLRQPLRQAGFEVIELSNLQSNDIETRLFQIGPRLRQADRVVVVLSGHFASRQGRSWLVTIDEAKRHPFTIGRYGVSFDAIWSLIGAKHGNAILAIAASGANPDIGPSLAKGYDLSHVPQGMTVVAGTPAKVVNFLPELLVPDLPMREVARTAPSGLRVIGYLPVSHAFIEKGPGVFPPANREERDWQQASALNTVDAYQRYLVVYPNGIYAAEAQARIQELSLTPADRARLAEEALNLTKNRRARLQQYLTILGFDTRGVDGVFGPRSRNAIAAWQASLGIQATGFLSANQVARIEQDGALRAEQLRREAELKKRQQEAEDRAYWQQTGASGNEQGLMAYLQRYPNGLFADQATERLKQIERDKRRQARLEERLAWDNAVILGTVQSYQAYLNVYPNGIFSNEARARIQTLSQPQTPPSVIDQARAAEQALGLDPIRKRLIEGQLQRLGLNPGRVDGDFDRKTRQAIAKYQQQTNQPVTGYVSKELLVLMLVGALGR